MTPKKDQVAPRCMDSQIAKQPVEEDDETSIQDTNS